MNKEEIEDYIKKLKEFETELSNEDDLDFNFINELNGVLNKINTDIKNETQETPIVNNSLVVKVKKLSDNAVIPSYSKVGDAGMDLTITREIENFHRSLPNVQKIYLDTLDIITLEATCRKYKSFFVYTHVMQTDLYSIMPGILHPSHIRGLL